MLFAISFHNGENTFHGIDCSIVILREIHTETVSTANTEFCTGSNGDIGQFSDDFCKIRNGNIQRRKLGKQVTSGIGRTNLHPGDFLQKYYEIIPDCLMLCNTISHKAFRLREPSVEDGLTITGTTKGYDGL